MMSGASSILPVRWSAIMSKEHFLGRIGGLGGNEQTTRPHRRQWCFRFVRGWNACVQIGHAETALSSSQRVILCSASRICRSFRAAEDSTTPFHRSAAPLPFNSEKSRNELDRRALGDFGREASGEKCRSTNFSSRRSNRFSSALRDSRRLERNDTNSSVRTE